MINEKYRCNDCISILRESLDSRSLDMAELDWPSLLPRPYAQLPDISYKETLAHIALVYYSRRLKATTHYPSHSFLYNMTAPSLDFNNPLSNFFFVSFSFYFAHPVHLKLVFEVTNYSLVVSRYGIISGLD